MFRNLPFHHWFASNLQFVIVSNLRIYHVVCLFVNLQLSKTNFTLMEKSAGISCQFFLQSSFSAKMGFADISENN